MKRFLQTLTILLLINMKCSQIACAQESLTTVLEELASLKVQNSRLGRDSLIASEHATQMHSEATLSICLTLSRIPKVTVTIHLTLRLA